MYYVTHIRVECRFYVLLTYGLIYENKNQHVLMICSHNVCGKPWGSAFTE